MANQHTGNDWTVEQDELIRLKLSQGYSAGRIAREFGYSLGNRTRSAIIGRCHRMGIGLNGQKSSFWNTSSLEALERLYYLPLGYTWAQMAAELGTSASNIGNGIAQLRAGRNLPAKPSPTQFKPGHKRIMPRKAAMEAWKAPSGAPTPPTAITLAPDVTPAPAVSIIDLEHHHCRWPVDVEGQAMHYCGQLRMNEDTSYCDLHHCQAHARG